MKIAITGGASAGHVVPALAVASQLRDRGADLVYLGRESTIEHDYAQRAGIPFRHVPSAGLRRHRSARNLRMPFTVARGILAAYGALRRERPDALFSKGSYVSVPVGIGAALARVPVVIHESDHSLGLANKILGRLATTICLSVPASGPTPRWMRGKTEVTGLPLRADLAHAKPEVLRDRLGVPTDKRVLLIFCGSSGSQRINTAIRSELAELCEQYSVLHVVGKGNLAPQFADRPGYWQLEYLHDDMPHALALADLVIGRAGATTLAELTALDLPAVLVPLPASVSRGDQLDNARAYATRHPERCRVVADEQLTDPGVLIRACAALSAVPRGGQGTHHRPEAAAERVAEFVLRAAGRQR
ncbi:UDP-N-acetylglucosamine--N-acetylmuramyl-(pentapeptide) pyrophosphoryl-undecaprenol N-acetylglucosamine transferase [Streptomyces noursei]|uniref:UDP-N-acetylglucosamine--N-acetylmuramyl- (pentapeptide) pyrophosphoryl-undecaprenol N-acetylglucosamine transferase n=1 Tax=Streptomyces noursei TaxID=1971 RepID=UPI001672E371|nr:UDP-N-acetylglucosamine--N-acetylmuramyl-(pentapeptide) pyrophosphoryl-undecaprenol N-acetylglucosamine transferase [Streptomyces noursei]MCZ1021351.1 UDP-N-acetylglucosamine--N-acetylmuramyl-(pentapeptide) pyrophosphoryl-undecaprenol N-acetylglucosamine transferase [Streptomyces noursei]GGX51875.1 UDP-N-acetylglucosamine--N-acetylmuramyl-(pentapeptide) pyrophosphoryl-undecaprenol N-acetylglucosamine transferase [Streptomyces noursei]